MKNDKKKIAIIGTNGIPARYGGFETLSEHLTKELEKKFDFTVYCSNIYEKDKRVKFYNNSKLIYLPFKANGFQSIFYCCHIFLLPYLLKTKNISITLFKL